RRRNWTARGSMRSRPSSNYGTPRRRNDTEHNGGLPLYLGDAGTMVHGSGKDEQQIGEPVHVTQQDGIDRGLQRDHPAFGTPADRAGDVQRGAGRRTAGQDEAP